MKELLTKEEIELIMTYCDFDMRLRPTAESMHYDRRTVMRMFTTIFQKTGYNPREFWDLFLIAKELVKGDADERDEIPPNEDGTNACRA